MQEEVTGKKKIRENLVQYAIYLTVGFKLLSAVLSFWNRHVTYDTRRIIEACERIRVISIAIRKDLIEDVDFGVKAFASSKDDTFLKPYHYALSAHDSLFRELNQQLVSQEIGGDHTQALESSVIGFLKKERAIISSIKERDSSGVSVETDSDELQRVSITADEYLNEVIPLVEETDAHAMSDYQWSITDNAIIQIILVILSISILLIASRKLKAEIRNRNKLLHELGMSNRKYLYDSGQPKANSVNSVITDSIHSLQQAYTFVEQVSKGDFTHAKNLIPDNAKALNESTLMGALLRMSLRLQQAESEENIRKWNAEGLNEFYKIVRNNADDLGRLADESVVFITKYLSSQQGGLFLLQQKGGNSILELTACYAFDRKKWITKEVGIGEGIVGQTFLEGQVTMMTDVPNGYTHITSGLGDAPPTCLLVVPLLYDEKVEGVIEIAGFIRYQSYHIDFVKSAGEFLAAALQNTKSRHQIQRLLDQSKAQAEMLRSKEEELRQNLEVLEATNEAMRRGQSKAFSSSEV